MELRVQWIDALASVCLSPGSSALIYPPLHNYGNLDIQHPIRLLAVTTCTLSSQIAVMSSLSSNATSLLASGFIQHYVQYEPITTLVHYIAGTSYTKHI